MGSDKKQFAAFTFSRNEPLFLQVWCNYYGNALGYQHLYVIDNSTTDDSINTVKQRFPDLNIISKPMQPTNFTWITREIENFQQHLLKTYEIVIYSDTDEYLIHSIQYTGLIDYCEQFRTSDKQWARATGWNVVHQVDDEPLIDNVPGTQLLQQRNAMWRCHVYDKTLITKIPLIYAKGCHNFYRNGSRAVDEPLEPDFDLLHAWCIDYKQFLHRHGPRLTLDEEGVKTIFRNIETQTNSFGDGWAEGQVQKIPSHWVGLIKI